MPGIPSEFRNRLSQQGYQDLIVVLFDVLRISRR